MKRTLYLLMGVVLSFSVLMTGCGDGAVDPVSSPDSQPGITTNATPVSSEISFVTRATIRTRGGAAFPTMNSLTGEILRSKAQLDAAKLDAFDFYHDEDTIDLSPYTEAYFSHKALVALYFTMSSGSYTLLMDELTVQEETLTVQYTKKRPGWASNDIAYWCVLLEVDQAAVQTVKAVKAGTSTEVTGPSGSVLEQTQSAQ